MKNINLKGQSNEIDDPHFFYHLTCLGYHTAQSQSPRSIILRGGSHVTFPDPIQRIQRVFRPLVFIIN